MGSNSYNAWRSGTWPGLTSGLCMNVEKSSGTMMALKAKSASVLPAKNPCSLFWDQIKLLLLLFCFGGFFWFVFSTIKLTKDVRTCVLDGNHAAQWVDLGLQLFVQLLQFPLLLLHDAATILHRLDEFVLLLQCVFCDTWKTVSALWSTAAWYVSGNSGWLFVKLNANFARLFLWTLVQPSSGIKMLVCKKTWCEISYPSTHALIFSPSEAQRAIIPPFFSKSHKLAFKTFVLINTQICFSANISQL